MAGDIRFGVEVRPVTPRSETLSIFFTVAKKVKDPREIGPGRIAPIACVRLTSEEVIALVEMFQGALAAMDAPRSTDEERALIVPQQLPEQMPDPLVIRRGHNTTDCVARRGGGE